ncbi:MAG: DUF481 domain-containing protein [Hyphomonadaceae bacterium]|nr:DUF481 domain-containing protein [Hyphomonadaceae bacterium]
MTFSQYLKLAAFAGAMTIALPAHAQDETSNGWSGEGSLSAGVTTGNTETTDLGLGVDVAREMNVWTIGLQATADYGETDGAETKNRIFLGSNLDRQINDRLFGFGQLSYERDEFSGFESRAFIGAGLGYDVIASDATQWTVRGGPGLKIDEIEAVLDMTVTPATVLSPATTEESFGATAQSNFAHAFNDNVAFTNDTSVLYADTSTQIGNIAAITATLTDTLSARVSFEVRHDTNPVMGFEDTDTISRVSLVYGFGK